MKFLKLKILLGIVFAVFSAYAQSAEVVCGYCIEAKLLNDPTLSSQPFEQGANSVLINAPPTRALILSNHVCEGPVVEVLAPLPLAASHSINLRQNTLPFLSMNMLLPHLRICAGTLVQLDEYRQKPLVAFGKNLVAGERKEFLDRVNAMAKNLEPEKVEAAIRKLLEEKDGPLAKQRTDLVAEAADQVVKLLTAQKPPVR